MKKLWIILIIVLIVLAPIAWYLISPAFIVKEANDQAPEAESQIILKSAELIASAHDVEGTAKIIQVDDSRILRFENLDTINGPDLYIYLATDTEAGDFVSLGRIKATKGNVNYDIPADADLDKYNKVLIWCEQFSVLFSYGELK